MRAVPFFEHGSSAVLQYREDFPDPVASKGEVIVTVEYCGINYLDIWTKQGIAGKNIMLPHICGCDIIGPSRDSEGWSTRSILWHVYSLQSWA